MRIGPLALLIGSALVATASAAAQTVPGVPARAAEAPRYEGWTWPDRPLPASLAADTTTAPADPWLGRDKVLHAAGSFFMTLSAQYVLTSKGELSDGEAFPLSAATVLALGVAKEVYDSRRREHPLFSIRDLAADAAGVLLAAAVISL
jgi:uncharacterized protein YfiM (DUF2279 family)